MSELLNSHITLGNIQYVCGNSLHRTYKLNCLLPCKGSLPRLENKKRLTPYPCNFDFKNVHV